MFLFLVGLAVLIPACTTSPSGDPVDPSSQSSSSSKKGKAPTVSLYDYECGHYYIRVRYKVESKSKLTDYQIYYGEKSSCRETTSTVKSGDYIKSSITCQHGKDYYFKAVVENEYGKVESSVTKLTSKKK